MPAPTSAAGAAEGGPPRTELQELQLKAGQTTDEVSDTYMYTYICIHMCVCIYIYIRVRDVTATRIYDAATKSMLFRQTRFSRLSREGIYSRRWQHDNRHRIFCRNILEVSGKFITIFCKFKIENIIFIYL